MFVVNQYVCTQRKVNLQERTHLHKASNYIPNIQLITKAACKAGLHLVKKLASVCYFVLGFAIFWMQYKKANTFDSIHQRENMH